MGMFDQTARQASKIDGGPFFAWVLRRFDPLPPLAFERWDDTRRLTVPGDPDRTNDLVAVLRRTDDPTKIVYLVVEVESEPERHIFQRVGIYELLLSMEVATGDGDDPGVGGLVVNLTGQQRPGSLELVIPGTTAGTRVEPVVINLRNEDASATLADIVVGKVGLCLLPWVPMMAGAGDPALIERWKETAAQEPDAHKRVAYRDLALVFAELSRELVNWQRGLEGWEMQESQVIRGWINRGKLEGSVETRRADVLTVVRMRLQDPVPEAIRLAVEGTNDLAMLERWFEAAVQAQTLADLRAAMKLEA